MNIDKLLMYFLGGYCVYDFAIKNNITYYPLIFVMVLAVIVLVNTLSNSVKSSKKRTTEKKMDKAA